MKTSKESGATAKTNLDRLKELEQANLRCAHIIAAEPERYAGLMLAWATKVLGKEPK